MSNQKKVGQGKQLILSFDDGPAPSNALESILKILTVNKIKAEFYVLGSEVKKYPTKANLIVTLGHKIQNHSWSHVNLAKASKQDVRSEIEKTQQFIKKTTGATATKVRPPYGAGGWPKNYDPELAEVAGKLSLQIQNWDIDTRDWAAPQGIGEKKLKEIKKQFEQKKGKIILNVLMHVQQATANDLQSFISQLKDWGFEFATPTQ